MIPSTGTLVLLNRSTARRASISDRSCGVETITAPAGRERWISDSCTSPVPGGRSTSSSSQSPQSASIRLASAPVAIGPRQASAWPGETSWPSDRNLMPCASTGISLSSSAVGLAWLPSKRRLRRAINVGVDQPDLLAHPRQRDGEVGRRRSTCRRRPCRCRWRSACAAVCAAVIAIARLAHAGNGQRRVAQLALERIAVLLRQAGGIGDDRRDAAARACASGSARRAAGRSADRPDGP